jgi:hypothetical protein
MKVNTALGFIAIGAWLGFLCREKCLHRAFALACWTCGVFAALLGLVTLVEHFSGGNFGIDHFVFGAELAPRDEIFLARMAPASALNFLLLGVAMLLVRKQTVRACSAAQTAVLLTLATAFCAFIGYLYGVK